MARPRLPNRGRTDARLDPIRWRRPGRGALLRVAAIAALLVTAALIAWSGPETCESTPTLAGGASTARRSSASAGRTAGPLDGTTPRAAGQAQVVDPVGSGGRTEGAAGGNGRATVPAGSVGVPVRLAEPTALALIRPGDRVDLLRVDDDSHNPSRVAAAALVLGVTGVEDLTPGGLLVALTPAEAASAVADPGRGFAVLIRP